MSFGTIFGIWTHHKSCVPSSLRLELVLQGWDLEPRGTLLSQTSGPLRVSGHGKTAGEHEEEEEAGQALRWTDRLAELNLYFEERQKAKYAGKKKEGAEKVQS